MGSKRMRALFSETANPLPLGGMRERAGVPPLTAGDPRKRFRLEEGRIAVALRRDCDARLLRPFPYNRSPGRAENLPGSCTASGEVACSQRTNRTRNETERSCELLEGRPFTLDRLHRAGARGPSSSCAACASVLHGRGASPWPCAAVRVRLLATPDTRRDISQRR